MLESEYQNEKTVQVLHGKISHITEFEDGVACIAFLSNNQESKHYYVSMEFLERYKLAYRDKDNNLIIKNKLPEDIPVMITIEFGRVAKIQRKDN